jgi:hypothetical protein
MPRVRITENLESVLKQARTDQVDTVQQQVSSSLEGEAFKRALVLAAECYINLSSDLITLIKTPDIMLWGETVSNIWTTDSHHAPASSVLRIAVHRETAAVLVDYIVKEGGCVFVTSVNQQKDMVAALGTITSRQTDNLGHCLGVLSFKNNIHNRRTNVYVMSSLVSEALFMAKNS